MSAILRSIDTLLKWLGVLLIASPLLWAVFARIDVPLNPEAEAWRQPETDDIAPDQNAYYAIIGFYAEDPAADINRAGRRMLEEYVERLKRDPGIEEFKYRQERKISGKPSELCSPMKGSCLKLVRAHRDQVARLQEDNAILLQRYHSLYRYRHHRETAPSHFSSPLPNYPGAPHELFLAQIAQEAQERQTRALEALARDTEFWRMVMRESRHMLGKAVATRFLLANLHLLSDVLASLPIRERDAAIVERMLRPLDGDDRSLNAAIRHEYKIAATGWGKVYTDAVNEGLEKHSRLTKAILLPFAATAFRPNHTTNLAHEYYAELARTDPAESNKGDSRTPALGKRRFGESVWDFVYNPLGKYFAYGVHPDFSAYRARILDLDGFVRLVTLQWTIQKNRIAVEKIPALLAASQETLRDPHTGRPMNWDAETKTLWFPRKGARKDEKDRLDARLISSLL